MPAPDYAASRRVIARHSKSFALAARLLPSTARDHAAAVYGWCRACDDAIDLGDPAEHPATLETLTARLYSIYRGEAQTDPTSAAFQSVVADRAIPIDYPLELLEGMRMDAMHRPYASVDELARYAFRVAGTVGLMMCHVMRVADRRALAHAAHLGIAMQLTNIARDVAEDFARGRLYLPAELFDAETFAALAAARGGPLPARLVPQVGRAVCRLLAIADRYYASGDEGLAYLGWRPALAIRTARFVYAAIGTALARRDYDVLAGRAVVPGRTKLRLFARALGAALADLPRRRSDGLGIAVPDHTLGFAELAAVAPPARHAAGRWSAA